MSNMRRCLERQEREIKDRRRRGAEEKRVQQEEDEQVAMAVGLVNLESQDRRRCSQVGRGPNVDIYRHSQAYTGYPPEGQPLRFTNDMDIDEHKDVIYFTDSSTIFHRRQFMSSILNGDWTGRLLKYNKSNKEVTVLLRGLAFANGGVALSKDHSFVLVAETTTCRILRLWLHGPNAGNTNTFAELLGFPDNIRRNSKREFWVALHAKRGFFAKWFVSNRLVGKSLLKLPLDFKQLHSLLVRRKAHATTICWKFELNSRTFVPH
ncbi:unnamed protein product [Prunus armeniaca]